MHQVHKLLIAIQTHNGTLQPYKDVMIKGLNRWHSFPI